MNTVLVTMRGQPGRGIVEALPVAAEACEVTTVLCHEPATWGLARHIEGKESRMIPMFPELKPYLEEAFEQAAPETEFVINRYRSCNANLRTQLMRIIKRAGMKPWPKPFQNLRSTRETELMEKFPARVVCGWIGNSEAIALKHYLQVTDDDFERAVRGELEIGTETAATPANPAAQKVAQHAHAGGAAGGSDSFWGHQRKSPGIAGACDFLRYGNGTNGCHSQ